ncbi:hypothetical protein B7463_g6053, partial [Scytalidium lignicola]
MAMNFLHTKTYLLDRKSRKDYAILSHTWNSEPDYEVTYEDMMNHEQHKKSEYGKIIGACNEAASHGYEHIWIDTCCIDKKSSAETSEAINSMFRWYAEAGECVVYLSDVTSDFGDVELELHFRKSRWFTRGWTLQELLAPRKLLFYDKNWKFIGDRQQWKSIIKEVTTIHDSALTGDLRWMKRYSVAQKMSWASERVTTRPEDIAYSLIGMFNVNMPLLYGEGTKAFLRLQHEIIKDSDDQTIFCWDAGVPIQAENSQEFKMCGLLAPSPHEFRFSRNYVVEVSYPAGEPYSMTNTGMKITGPLHQIGSDYRLVLKCYDINQSQAVLKLPLRKLHKTDDQYARITDGLPYREVDNRKFDVGVKMRTIYIKQEIPEQIVFQATGKDIKFRLAELEQIGFNIQEVFPPEQWDESARIISAPNYDQAGSSFTNFSWHISVSLKSLQEGVSLTAFLGYNGRCSTSWCKLFHGDFRSDIETFWRGAAMKLTTEDTTKNTSKVRFHWDGKLWEFVIVVQSSEHLFEPTSANATGLFVNIGLLEPPSEATYIDSFEESIGEIIEWEERENGEVGWNERTYKAKLNNLIRTSKNSKDEQAKDRSMIIYNDFDISIEDIMEDSTVENSKKKKIRGSQEGRNQGAGRR